MLIKVFLWQNELESCHITLSLAEYNHDTVAPFNLDLYKLILSYAISKLLQDSIGCNSLSSWYITYSWYI